MRRVPGVLWIAAGAVLWGTDAVLRRPLTGVLAPTQIVLYEHLILSVVVFPFVYRQRALLAKLSRRGWIAVLGTAWIGSAFATVLFTAAIRSGNPTTAVLLQKTQPMFAIILARLALRESWPRHFLSIALLAVGGAYLVTFGDGHVLSPTQSLEVWPSLLALGAAAGWASSTIWGRMAGAELPFEVVTGLRILCAAPMLILVAGLQGQAGLPHLDNVPSLVWIALVPGFAGLLLYYRGLRQTPASAATIAELAFPASASLLNWMILGVAPTAIQITGFAVVWAVIFRLSRKPGVLW